MLLLRGVTHPDTARSAAAAAEGGEGANPIPAVAVAVEGVDLSRQHAQ